MTIQIQNLIKDLRQRIEDDNNEFDTKLIMQLGLKYIDEFIEKPNRSDLEKAFFLILNQFPGDRKNYVVIPSEMVLIPDIYDMKSPGIEYEIDFALYGGPIDNPIKVAIECDGIRSHGQKHNNKDRRKDVNLQTAGWIVMRFGSKEIHEELQKFKDDNFHISDFLQSIENTIEERLKLIDTYSYFNNEFRSKLTGYKWDEVHCTNCGKPQNATLNHKTLNCRHCKTKFKRIIKDDEKIKYDMNGILFFKD